MGLRRIHVAIPAMGEADHLPDTIRCLERQMDHNLQVWVCVNQPDHWWADDEKRAVCENNRRTLSYLESVKTDQLRIIDCSSPGKGWNTRAYGVGMARKVLMDQISQEGENDDIILSMDADTTFPDDYLESVRRVFAWFPMAMALSNPYYHELSGEEALDRAMLRYEIYMRYYVINMWRIGSPYSYTALGSAIALPIWAYRKVGGMTAKKSGEDFYFLQKLRKSGWICNHNERQVHPATRYSDRVFFGTGPALIKGSQGLWDSYPIYDYTLFDQVAATYAFFPLLFKECLVTPMSSFLQEKFREVDPFDPLRKNADSIDAFVRACHQKVDGLRVLQFLKGSNHFTNKTDEEKLLDFLQQDRSETPDLFLAFLPGLSGKDLLLFSNKGFSASPLVLLDKIRNLLRRIELSFQENDTP